MTELIVALDLPTALEARGYLNTLLRDTDVQWFKVGVRVLLTSGSRELLDVIVDRANLFLDLKLYETPDTAEAAARCAFGLGARLLTVYAARSMLAAAMGAKILVAQKVLAVARLTDDLPSGPQADGLICSVATSTEIRSRYKGILVCPGIRPAGANADNHILAATPRQACDAGADYIVVGRPIIGAADPAAAARAIMAETVVKFTPAKAFNDRLREDGDAA